MQGIVKLAPMQLVLILLLLVPWMNSVAQVGADADTKEVQAFKLTEAGLGKYTKATHALSELSVGCDDNSDANSIAEMVARLNSYPGAETAIQGAGMTTREYVVFSMSLLHNAMAGWVAREPGGSLPPGTSQANVDFLNSHEADLNELNASGGSDSCGEEDYEEEEFGEGDYEEESPEE
jgi:hypothetical protein